MGEGAHQEAPAEDAAAPPPARDAATPGPGARPIEPTLSRGQVERVIARALELQDQADVAPQVDRLTLRQVQDVAGQVGIDPELLRRALAEVRLAGAPDPEPSRTERVLGPERIRGATLLPVAPGAARRAVAGWMVDDEGMRLAGTSGDTDRFIKDKRVMVELRRGLGVDRADGVLRDLRGVAVTAEPDPEGTVVRLEADTSGIRTAVAGIAAGGGLASLGLGIAAAAVIPDGASVLAGDAAQLLATAAVGLATTAGTAAAVRRAWVARVRMAVDAALQGIDLAAQHPDGLPARDPLPGWRGQVQRWLGGPR